MIETTITILIGLLIVFFVLIGGLAFLANFCFYDDDPDMYPNDNYSVLTCPHSGNKTDVTVKSTVTCETIHTYCDDCGEVLNVRTDCV